MTSSILTSFTPKTLTSLSLTTHFQPSTSSFFKFQTKVISSFGSFLSQTWSNERSFSCKVAELRRYEDVMDDGEEVGYGPELKLFVGNLPFGVDSDDLAGLFAQAGTVELVEVIYDKQSGRSRGFAFVTMSTVEEVKAAERQFNRYEIEGRQMRVNSGPPPPKDDFSPRTNSRRDDSSSRGNSRFSRRGDFSSRDDSGRRGGFSTRGSRDDFSSRGSRDNYSSRGSRDDFSTRGSRDGGSGDSSNRVYVGNLSWGVDDSALQTLFSEEGNVTEARVVYDRESGQSRGFGFVTYSSAKEVDGAISSLDGADLDGRPIRVSMAEAKPRRQF